MASPYGEDIAVLKDQMKDVKTALDRIETKLDNSAATYATKSELKTFKWVTVPLVTILTVVITFLVTYYLTHNKTPITNVTNTNTTSPTTGTTGSSTTPGATSTTTNTTEVTPRPSPTPTTNSLGGAVDGTLKQVGL